MRVLYIDIDSLRPDHLGCYGYHRETSPNIDRIAADAVRFEKVYISDAPCLPSRTALWSGRFGFGTGVVNHGGVAAQPYIEGPQRGARDLFDRTGWMRALRDLGYKTATVSSFGERHAAWHWYAGFHEIYNPGGGGNDMAHEVNAYALPWLEANAGEDNWFLHVNYWDPHTPYRTPESFGDPFADDPLPEWLTEEVRQQAYERGFGPHSAHEPHGFGYESDPQRYPRLPVELDSMDAVRRWIDGYDTGIRYADEHIGQLIAVLEQAGVLDETVIIVSADHGENQGELNVWGDHQTADEYTCHIPLIVRFPGVTPRVDHAMHYHFDWAATLIELLGGEIPTNWDGVSFADAFRSGAEEGRDHLILSQQTWSCQRAVRFDDMLCIRTYHDGYKDFPEVMLFDLDADPHEQNNLAASQPETVNRAMKLLTDWQSAVAQNSPANVDPMMTVLREGGPFYTRGELERYAERLRNTGRPHAADQLLERHPDER